MNDFDSVLQLGVHELALAVITVCCVLGVFSARYNDTFFQRIGLGLTALGCVSEIVLLLIGGDTDPARTLSAVGVAVYGLGTVLKRMRYPDPPPPNSFKAPLGDK